MQPAKMNILLTNDDGIKAPGLEALVQSLPDGVKAMIVAPANEKSASSHSISLGQKLRVEEIPHGRIFQYAVHGTPADCVKFALSELKDFNPDLIIAGINQGANTGVSVYYSGTISAAREGLINRVPSMAVSLCSRTLDDFTTSTRITRDLIEGYAQGFFPRGMMLNVNIPPIPWDEIRGSKVTKQAASHFIEEFVCEKQHDGKRVYTLAGEIALYDADGTSDEEAISAQFVSITPLKLDSTDYAAMPALEKWIRKEVP
jgi:5'-nucleotidase